MGQGSIRSVRASAVTRADEIVDAAGSPAARLELATRFYTDHARVAGIDDYARSELAFMRWEIERGVLDPEPPVGSGSPWWRAVNARLLRDAAEADLLAAAGVTSGGSNPAVDLWLAFLGRPAPEAWYRAHNASIAGSYVCAEARRLATNETLGEQALMNVVLYRVLFAHALIANPALALGHLGFLGRLLGDPRSDVVDLIVRIPDFYPRQYPMAPGHERGVLDAVVDCIDDVVVQRHIDALYAFEADVLGLPELASLVCDGRVCYPTQLGRVHVERGGLLPRLLGAVLGPLFDVTAPIQMAVAR